MCSSQHELIDSNSTATTVYVVDGDQSILHSVQSLLGTLGIRVTCYRSAEQFLDHVDLDKPGCVITEVHLPGISGLDLQETLRRRHVHLPVIVMASDADVPIAVRAMALGALDFIEKPFVDRVLITRVKQALHMTDRANSGSVLPPPSPPRREPHIHPDETPPETHLDSPHSGP